MAKPETRELMRRKINSDSAELHKKWVELYRLELRQPIHASLLKEEDLDQHFEHQGRTFQIKGLTIAGTVMLYEPQFDAYWEATRHFVQMKLDRWNQEFRRIAGTTQLRTIPYPEHKLFLPPIKKQRGPAKPEPVEDENFNEPQFIPFVEDEHTEI
jgi:hypothetical protein